MASREDLLRTAIRDMHDTLGSPEVHEGPMKVKGKERQHPYMTTYHRLPDDFNPRDYKKCMYPSIQRFMRGALIKKSWFSLVHHDGTTVREDFLTRQRSTKGSTCADCQCSVKGRTDMAILKDETWENLVSEHQRRYVLCWACMNKRARRRFKRRLNKDDLQLRLPCTKEFLKAHPRALLL